MCPFLHKNQHRIEDWNRHAISESFRFYLLLLTNVEMVKRLFVCAVVVFFSRMNNLISVFGISLLKTGQENFFICKLYWTDHTLVVVCTISLIWIIIWFDLIWFFPLKYFTFWLLSPKLLTYSPLRHIVGIARKWNLYKRKS